MGTEALKMMKEQLMSCVQGQLGDISKADAHELGEAVDMIKDLSEAIYYCTITDSMEKAEEKEKSSVSNINYYTTPMYPEYRNMERNNGYMYYSGGSGNMGGNSSSNGGTTSYYTEMMRDPR